MDLFKKLFGKNKEPKYKTYGELLENATCKEDLGIGEIKQSPIDSTLYSNKRSFELRQEGIEKLERKRYIG